MRKGYLRIQHALIDICKDAYEIAAAVDLCDMCSYKGRQNEVSYRSLAMRWGGKWDKDSVRRFMVRLAPFFTLVKDGNKTYLQENATPSATPSATPNATPKRLKDSTVTDKFATPSATPNATPSATLYINTNKSNIITPLTPLKGGVPPIYAKFDFSFVDDDLASCFADWLLYKHDELKFTYKTQTSLEVCYKDLKTKSDGDPVTARMIVEQSIANGWKGLFKLKNDYGQTATNGYGQGDNAQFLQQAAAYISTIRDGDFDSDRPPV